MSGVIRWEDPPDGRSGRRRDQGLDHDVIAEDLRSRPGQWGLISTGTVAASVISKIGRGTIPSYRPEGSFEARTRNIGGVVCVYARYVGEAS